MPIHQGYEVRGGERLGYYQWGEHGKRYYYTPGDDEERARAKERAEKQGRAAHARGYRG